MANLDSSPALIDFFAKDSNPKRQKLKEEIGKEDRISILPDAILCYILSFLPTLFAIGTSTLSKRWKNLWTFIENFEFDDSLHACTLSFNKPKSFIKFGDMVFKLSRAKSIHKFQLRCLELDCGVANLHEWICSAVTRNPEDMNIQIRIHFGISFKLSESVFTCQTLVVLKLSASFIINLPTVVSFPNLKTLHLCLLKFFVDDPMKTILSGCPILQELYLRDVTFENLRRLSFLSPTLKSLRMQSFSHMKWYSLIVDAPQLVYLSIDNHCLKHFDIMSEMPLLREASISVSPRLQESATSDELSPCLFEILPKISSVKYLKFSWNADACISNAFDNMLPLYCNLTCMEINIFGSWQLMSQLLECSPKLKFLICEKASRCNVNRDERRRSSTVPCLWHPPDNVPKCLSVLERIEIRLNGCRNEINLVGYLLKNGTRLRSMRIDHSNFFVKTWEVTILKEMIKFPRASNACELDFS